MSNKILFIPHLLGIYTGEDTGLFHIIRDISLAKELLKLKPSLDIMFVCTGLRVQMVKKTGFKVIEIPKISFHSTINEFHEMFEYLYSIINDFDPDLVIGDMFTYPAIITDFLNKPFICIVDYIAPSSRNVLPRLIASKIDLVIVCQHKSLWPVPRLLKRIEDKIAYVGPILRSFNDLLKMSKRKVKENIGLCPENNTILVTMGGSGIYKEPFKVLVNTHKMLSKSIPNLTTILHLARLPAKSLKLTHLPDKITVIKFVSDLAPYIRASDIVVTRGGHGTLYEAASLGTPIIATAIPGPMYYEEKCNIYIMKHLVGNVIHIPYPYFTPSYIAKVVKKLILNRSYRMRLIEKGLSIPRDGREKAAKLILSVLKEQK